MDMALKQRLVGAAVIIAVAVIVIPLLLDGSGEPVISEIPPRPASIVTDPYRLTEGLPPVPSGPPPVEVESPPPVNPGAGAPAVEAHGDAAPPVPEAASAQKPAAASQPQAPVLRDEDAPGHNEPAAADGVADKLQAWVVQVGSFTEQEKAHALRDELLASGFKKAYVEKYSTPERVMYRVRIGPEMERVHAEQALARLQSKTGRKGYVASHP